MSNFDFYTVVHPVDDENPQPYEVKCPVCHEDVTHGAGNCPHLCFIWIEIEPGDFYFVADHFSESANAIYKKIEDLSDKKEEYEDSGADDYDFDEDEYEEFIQIESYLTEEELIKLGVAEMTIVENISEESVPFNPDRSLYGFALSRNN
jgi:hypothetical protein